MGRYSSRNLMEFEFHDAWADEIRRKGDVLTCRVKHLNLHASAPENPYPQDMELKEALLTFSGFQVKEYCLPAYECHFQNGRTEAHPKQQFFEAEAEKRFSQAAAEGFRLTYVGPDDQACWTLEACGKTVPYFTLAFSFRQALVEWEEFAGKAWYVNFPSNP